MAQSKATSTQRKATAAKKKPATKRNPFPERLQKILSQLTGVTGGHGRLQVKNVYSMPLLKKSPRSALIGHG